LPVSDSQKGQEILGIRNVENNALVGLHSLEYLDLSHNPIDALPESLLCDSPNIEILKLQNIILFERRMRVWTFRI
jgi:Leucine-rich repeat (LRR) protein